jgi:hypothetical protein
MALVTGDGMAGLLSALFESKRGYRIDSNGASRRQIASKKGREAEHDDAAGKCNRIVRCDSVEQGCEEPSDRCSGSRTENRSNQDEAGAVTGYQKQKILS